MFTRWILSLGLVTSIGCARPLPPVTATVQSPAEAPVSCSTAVHFVDGPEVAILVRRLATALAASGTPASVLPSNVAIAHRQRGSLQPGSVVIHLQLSIDEGVTFVPMPQGAGGHQPWGKARGSLTVFDGPTGTSIRRIPVEANAGNAREALAKAEQQILSAFRAGASSREIRMPAVEDGRVVQAVSDMRRWRWTEARRALEALDGCCSEDPSTEAAYQYVLAIARRFDPETLSRPESHFERAVEALRRAVELAPEELLYRNALSVMLAEARAFQLLEEQRQMCRSRSRSLRVASPTGPSFEIAPGTGGVQPAPTAPGGVQPAPAAPALGNAR